MILDSLQNAQFYKGLHPNLDIALDYVVNTDFSSLEMGVYKIKGDAVFAILQSYETKPIEEAKLEAHKKYVDIQLMIQGDEVMGVTPLTKAHKVIEDYPEKDLTFYEGEGQDILVEEGSFTIFFQTDAHAPGILVNSSKTITKVVVKVEMS